MVRLGELLKIQSHRENYQEMHDFIVSKLELCEGVTYKEDEVGNIYATKGELEIHYPAFVCRTNSDQKIVEGFKTLRLGKSHTWVAFRKSSVNESMIPTGIGGDAKCGIYLCLKLLETLPAVKCVFFVESGTGFKGAMNCDLDFFRDCRWVIEFDRKGSSTIVTKTQSKDLCSKDFHEKLEVLGKKHNYTTEYGGQCDVSKLKTDRKLDISVANISCGYYRPNSDNERVIGKSVMRALIFAKDIAASIKEPSTHQLPSYTQSLAVVPKTPSPERECQNCNRMLKPADIILCDDCMDKACPPMNISARASLCTVCGLRLYKMDEIEKKQCSNHGDGRILYYG